MGGRIFEVIGNKRVWEEGCHFKMSGKEFFRVEEAAIKKKKKKKKEEWIVAAMIFYHHRAATDFLLSTGCS